MGVSGILTVVPGNWLGKRPGVFQKSRMYHATLKLIPALGLALLCSCAAQRSDFTHAEGIHYYARPKGTTISVFREDPPNRSYREISKVEAWFTSPESVLDPVAEALPALKKRARESGADAIWKPEVKESVEKGKYAYHVTATGIRYSHR